MSAKSKSIVSKRKANQSEAMRAWNASARADGFCVTDTGNGCGWRHAHSPNCPYRHREGGTPA